MFFNYKSIFKSQMMQPIITFQGYKIKVVSGFIIDYSLGFVHHIKQQVKNLKLKLGLYLRIGSCLSLRLRNVLLLPLLFQILDYGDIIYMPACSHWLHKLDSAWRTVFLTGGRALPHHCLLCTHVGWTVLFTHRFYHWYHFYLQSYLGFILPHISCTLLLENFQAVVFCSRMTSFY